MVAVVVDSGSERTLAATVMTVGCSMWIDATAHCRSPPFLRHLYRCNKSCVHLRRLLNRCTLSFGRSRPNGLDRNHLSNLIAKRSGVFLGLIEIADTHWIHTV